MFKTYLTEVENKNKYCFLIKIADDHCPDKLKSVLDKYKVSKFKKIEAAPIESTPFDFPELANASVQRYQIELSYPTTPLELQVYISEQTKIHLANIKITSDKEYTPEPKTKDPQKMVGDGRVSEFMKELQKDRKDQQPTHYTGVNDQLLAKDCPSGE